MGLNRGFIPAGLAALTLVGCSSSEPASMGDGGAKNGGRITIDGSSTVFVVTNQVAEGYMDAHPETTINLSFSGTGNGFKKFAAGETDISNASRPIEDKEIAALVEAKIEFIEVPVCYDGLTVAVSKDNTWVDHLTVAELKKMWEPSATGKVMKWSDVRPGWPDSQMHLFGPGTGSGTFDFFTKVIVGEEGASRTDYTPSEDDNQLVIGVADDTDAIGYFGFAYYLENQDKLRAVPIDAGKGAGPVAPSPTTIKDRTYAPLNRPEFIYVKKSSLEKPFVKGFVDYYVSPEGQELIRESGYIPFDAAVYRTIAKHIASGKVGSLFSGQMGKPVEDVFK